MSPTLPLHADRMPVHRIPITKAKNHEFSMPAQTASARTPLISDAASPTAQQTKLHIDLTDVVFHAVWHDTCAGIPRVQLEIATSLVKTGLDACPFALHDHKIVPLRHLVQGAADVDTLFEQLKTMFRHRMRLDWSRPGAALSQLTRTFARGFRRAQQELPDLTSRDTLFVAGAFWVSPQTIELCRRGIARGTRLFVLVHDLIPLIRPEFTGHDFRQQYLDVLKLDAHFIVTTELNRQHLEKVCRQISPGRTPKSSVVSLADAFPGSVRDECVCEQPATARTASLQGDPFALCVGTIEIRKNHLFLMDTWEELVGERHGELPVLVVAGRKGWKANEACDRLAASSPLRNRVLFIEAPTDQELKWLYGRCAFTVFPSHFEGWGLPVGESLWFGKPCAVSSDESLVPVARGLCLPFSPSDRNELKEAILRLLDDDQRSAWTTKIRAASLREWDDVGCDIRSVLETSRANHSRADDRRCD